MKFLTLTFALFAIAAPDARAQYNQDGYAQMNQALTTLSAQWGQPSVTRFQYDPNYRDPAADARAQYMQTLREYQSGNSNPYGYNTNFGNRCHPVPYYNAYGQWVANRMVCN